MPPKREVCGYCKELATSDNKIENGVCQRCQLANKYARSVRFGSLLVREDLSREEELKYGRMQYVAPEPKSSFWADPLNNTVKELSGYFKSVTSYFSLTEPSEAHKALKTSPVAELHGFPISNDSPLIKNPHFKSKTGNEQSLSGGQIDLIQPISSFSDPNAIIVPGDPTASSVNEPLFREDSAFKPTVRRAILFVHGYCNSQESALRRAAILKWDLIRLGVPEDFDMLAFTWPSANKFTHYPYDEESMAMATTFFKIWATQVFQDYDKVVVIPHSMGNRVVTYGLELLESQTLQKVERVIFTAPDIDLQVFKAKISKIQERCQFPYKIFCNSGDKAVKLSEVLHGNTPRVGTCTAQDLAKQLEGSKGYNESFQYDMGHLSEIKNFHDYCFTIIECTREMAKFIKQEKN